MKMLLGLLMPFLSQAIVKKSENCSHRWAYLIGFLLMTGAYIVGCVGLYHYLIPVWGETFSLLAVGLGILITSSLFFLIGWLCKPKATPLSKAGSLIETTLSGGASSRLPLVALVAVGAIAFYFATRNKEI